MARRYGRVCTTAVVVAGLALYGAAAIGSALHASQGEGLREVLATGDPVPTLGRIGSSGLSLVGLADDDRALVAAALSDGRTGLFWVDGHTLTPLWVLGDLGGALLQPFSARMSRDGHVVVPLLDFLPNGGVRGFAIFVPGQPARILPLGLLDGARNTICWAEPAFINDNGLIAFFAQVAPPGVPCVLPDEEVEPPLIAAVYTSMGNAPELVTTHRALQGMGYPLSWLTLHGVAADGSVVVDGFTRDGRVVLVVKGTAVRRLVGLGDVGPRGAPFTGYLQVLDANEAGDIVFQTQEQGLGGLYRTAAGQIVELVSEGDPLPGGGVYYALESAALGPTGDVVAISYGYVPDQVNTAIHGVFLYPANGVPRLIIRNEPNEALGPRSVDPDGQVRLNGAGHTGLTVQTSGGASGHIALRWSDGVLQRLIGTGDPAPQDSVFAARGLDAFRCLAGDGSVATGVFTTNGDSALLCGDGADFRPIVHGGMPAPGGGEFDGFQFGQCAFAGSGLTFSAVVRVPRLGSPTVASGIYAIRRGTIERLVGDGDPTPSGEIELGVASPQPFATNASGTLVVGGQVGTRRSLYLRRDGVLEEIAALDEPLPGADLRLEGVLDYGVTDDDDVVVRGVGCCGRANAIFVRTRGRWGLLATSDDLAQDGTAYGSFTGLVVRGRYIVFTANSNGRNRLFVKGPTDATPRQIFPVDSGDTASLGGIIDVAPGGRVLFSAVGSQSRYFVADAGGGLTKLPSFDERFDAFGISDDGALAFVSLQSALGTARHSILVTQPAPAASSCSSLVFESATVTPSPSALASTATPTTPAPTAPSRTPPVTMSTTEGSGCAVAAARPAHVGFLTVVCGVFVFVLGRRKCAQENRSAPRRNIGD